MSENIESPKPQILTLAALTEVLTRVPAGTDANDFPDRNLYRDNPELLELWANACIRVAARSMDPESIATFHIEAVDALRRRPGKWDMEDVQQLRMVGHSFASLVRDDQARRARLFSLCYYNAAYLHHAAGGFVAAADAHNTTAQSEGVSERDRLLAIYHYTWEMMHFAFTRDQESIHQRYSEYKLASRTLQRHLDASDKRWMINIRCWDLMMRYLARNEAPTEGMVDSVKELITNEAEASAHQGKLSCLTFIAEGDRMKVYDWQAVAANAPADMDWAMLHLYAYIRFYAESGQEAIELEVFDHVKKLTSANHGGHLGYELAKSIIMGD